MALLAWMFFDGQAIAAKRIDLRKIDIGNIRFGSATLATPRVHDRHKRALGIDPESTLFLIERDVSTGGRRYRYHQVFRGLRIYQSELTVEEDSDGNILSVSGGRFDGLAADLPAVAPKLSAEAARDLAMQALFGRGGHDVRISDTRVDMMIYIDRLGLAHRAFSVSWVAKFTRRQEDVYVRSKVIVDADTGRTLRKTGDVRDAGFVEDVSGCAIDGWDQGVCAER